MSSCWPKLWAALATSAAVQPGLQQFLHPGKAEELPLFVHGFHDSVRSQHQSVVVLQLEMGDGELGIVDHAQRSAPSISIG